MTRTLTLALLLCATVAGTLAAACGGAAEATSPANDTTTVSVQKPSDPSTPAPSASAAPSK